MYKMIRLKFKLDPNGNQGYFIDKWVQRLCDCANMTLDSHVLSSHYTAYINGGALTVRDTNFGTARAGSGSYTQYGFIMPILGNNNGDGLNYDARIVVDEDNNLVFGSPIFQPTSAAGNPLGGFLFVNDLIMNTNSANRQATYINMYSIGADPQKAGEFTFPTHFLNYAGSNDTQLYRSKLFWKDTNDLLGILDRVEWIFAGHHSGGDEFYQVNAYERTVVDEQTYLHIGWNMWLPIESEVTEEVIEVTA